MEDGHNPNIATDVAQAIRRLQQQIRWKPRKAEQHLRRRIAYGHLEATTTLLDYNQIIITIVQDPEADVYIYIWEQDIYPTVTLYYNGAVWLVMFGLNGIMETAFPPTDPKEYLADARFQFLGKAKDLLI